MAKSRKKIPEKLRAKLQQEINSECPVCKDMDVGHFEVHHIDENPENNDISNLLMLCRMCHSNITKGDITFEEAKTVKKILIIRNNKSQGKSISISGNVSSSTIANNIESLTIKTTRKPKIEPHKDSIGSNLEKKNYIKYLIDRYHEYKEYQEGKGNVKYPILYSIIKKQFKASVNQIPIVRFEELCQFLKKRIDGTKLGRINKSKNHRNYSEFLET